MAKYFINYISRNFKKKSELFDFFLIFMLVFAFPIISFLNSSKLALFIVFIIIIWKFNTIKSIISEFSQKKTIIFIIICFLFSFYTLFLTVLKSEYDYSLFLKQISAFIYIPCIFIFFIYFENKNIPKLIIYGFILQSLLIILSIASQSFYKLTNPLRADISAMHMASYGRLRGNAIAGYQFFGISTMYGFVIIYLLVKEKITSIKNLLILILLSIIGIISGRFTIVAIVLGLIMRFLFKSSLKEKIQVILWSLFSLLVAIILFMYYYNNFADKLTKGVIDIYIIDPVENLVEKGNTKTTSTSALEDMYKKVKFNDLIFGDGRYEEKFVQVYYEQVDPGYLRMLLYYGISGLIILFYIQYFLTFRASPRVTDDTLLKWSFLIYFFLLNYKGDVFFYSNNILPVIIGFIYFSNESKWKLKENCP